jgi:hypothetical protein
MVERIAPIRVISFCLLVACGAFCQSDFLPLVCFKGTAQTHSKCVARKCVIGNHFQMLRQYRLQHKQRNFTRSWMKRALVSST